jgi:hypothetical protein
MENRTRLIQRLKAPKGFNPFGSFGGGYVNGGLTDEAMEFLNKLWSFAYMGAAEFEWGAVPEALNKIAGYCVKEESGGFFEIQLEDGKYVIYVICKKDELKDVEEIIGQVYREEIRLKEWAGLKKSLEAKNKDDFCYDLHGWLELDNGFIFFKDEEMAKNTAKLFGLIEEDLSHMSSPRNKSE